MRILLQNMPALNINSIGGYHIREAGATRVQDLAFSMANGIAYIEAGLEGGLEVDEFVPAFTFNAFGGSMEIYQEIAFQRAARRVWAHILRDRFHAKIPRVCKSVSLSRRTSAAPAPLFSGLSTTWHVLLSVE